MLRLITALMNVLTNWHNKLNQITHSVKQHSQATLRCTSDRLCQLCLLHTIITSLWLAGLANTITKTASQRFGLLHMFRRCVAVHNTSRGHETKLAPCIPSTSTFIFLKEKDNSTYQRGVPKGGVGADGRKKVETFLQSILMREYVQKKGGDQGKENSFRGGTKLHRIDFHLHCASLTTYPCRVHHLCAVIAAQGHHKQHGLDAVEAAEPLPPLAPLAADIIQPGNKCNETTEILRIH